MYKNLQKKYPICINGSGIPSESDSEDESEIAKQVKSTYKFKIDDVVLTESFRALNEHKVKLFDGLYY